MVPQPTGGLWHAIVPHDNGTPVQITTPDAVVVQLGAVVAVQANGGEEDVRLAGFKWSAFKADVTLATICAFDEKVLPHETQDASVAVRTPRRAARSMVEAILNALPNQKIANRAKNKMGRTKAASAISWPDSSVSPEAKSKTV